LRRSISIIIPAYNEAQRLPGTLQKVSEYLGRSAWDFAEIVVVDDGSTDGTAEAARAAGARVLQNPGNRCKGYSVRHGMLQAQGEWALFTDADLSAPIEELDKLWSAAAREHAQVDCDRVSAIFLSRCSVLIAAWPPLPATRPSPLFSSRVFSRSRY